jgi:hypothetical protein
MPTLLRSQIECPSCHDIVASLHRHDFRSCRCGLASLDGGRDYHRVVMQKRWMRPPEDRSVRVEGDWNNQESRILLQAAKDIDDGERVDLPWVLEELERSGLIRSDGDSGWVYCGPKLARRHGDGSHL